METNNTWVAITMIVDDSVIEQSDVEKIIDPLWWSVSVHDGEDVYERDLKKYSKQQRYVFAIMWYQSEVKNGGHSQFYSNSTGIVWEDALLGSKDIGLLKVYDIIKESVGRFNGNPSKNRDERNSQIESQHLEFDDLDEQFYELIDLDSYLMKYIRDNREHFYFNGVIRKPGEF